MLLCCTAVVREMAAYTAVRMCLVPFSFFKLFSCIAAAAKRRRPPYSRSDVSRGLCKLHNCFESLLLCWGCRSFRWRASHAYQAALLNVLLLMWIPCVELSDIGEKIPLTSEQATPTAVQQPNVHSRVRGVAFVQPGLLLSGSCYRRYSQELSLCAS